MLSKNQKCQGRQGDMCFNFFLGIMAILKIMGFLGKMAIRGTFSFFKAKGHY
jgi:hypothetical protein